MQPARTQKPPCRGLVLKAESIVSLDMLVQYFGGHDRYRPECDLAYDNLMVMLWSTLATRDVRLSEQALDDLPQFAFEDADLGSAIR